MKGIQNMKDFSKSIKYIGADDKDLDLFESQYIITNGVSYNSYVVMDEKIAVMDTVDARKTNEWLANLEAALGGRQPDYLVISHLEPDHAANIKNFTEKYPSAILVGNAKTFAMLPQFLIYRRLLRSLRLRKAIPFPSANIRLILLWRPWCIGLRLW